MKQKKEPLSKSKTNPNENLLKFFLLLYKIEKRNQQVRRAAKRASQ